MESTNGNSANISGGEGSGGSETWNGGIKVEKQNSDGTWTTEMESTNGNSASKSEDTDTTCRTCPSGTIQYPGTHRCFARKWNGFLCNLDPATDPAKHHANDPKCVCSDIAVNTDSPTLTPTSNPTSNPTNYEKLACHFVPDHKYALADGTGPEYEYGSLMECFEKCDADPQCLGFLDRSSGGKKICAWKSDEQTLQQNPKCGNDYYRKQRNCQSSFLSYNGKCYGTVDWNLQPEPVRFNTPVSSSADNCDIEEWHEIPEGCQLAPTTGGITSDVVGKFEFGTYLLILANGGAYQNPTYGAGAGQRPLNKNFLQMGPTNRQYKTKCCGCKLLLQCDLGFGLDTSTPTANPTVEPTG